MCWRLSANESPRVASVTVLVLGVLLALSSSLPAELLPLALLTLLLDGLFSLDLSALFLASSTFALSVEACACACAWA